MAQIFYTNNGQAAINVDVVDLGSGQVGLTVDGNPIASLVIEASSNQAVIRRLNQSADDKTELTEQGFRFVGNNVALEGEV